MNRRVFIKNNSKIALGAVIVPFTDLFNSSKFNITVNQITGGENHHFFGYIGQSLTIPWNYNGDKILCMSSPFHDHLPSTNEAAAIAIIDPNVKSGEFNKIEKLDESLGWNHQQGTMFYWNPDAAQDQFFFNDRDPKTGVVFTVCYDVNKRKRIKEYRYGHRSFGNSGVCPLGKSFLGINYARMARLRPVTGYKNTTDWTTGVNAPKDDGIIHIDIKTGKKKMLVSFEQMAAKLEKKGFQAKGRNLFINHTLWNRTGEWIYFFVRAGWKSDKDGKEALDAACSIKVDGTNFTARHSHIGGHPEWGNGTEIIGSQNGRQVVYDILSKEIVRTIGDEVSFPDPSGDVSLSPDSKLFVNGYSLNGKNHYTIFDLNSKEWTNTPEFNTGIYKKDLRIDPAPRWNRESNQLLVSGLDKNGIRQLFVISIEQSKTTERLL